MHPWISSITRSHTLSLGAALWLAVSTVAARADTAPYCVNNDSDLVAALSIAQTTPLAVKLVQKTYHLNQTVWNANLTPSAVPKFRGGSSLLGGYIDANCATRNIAVGNTVITDTTANPFDAVAILGDAIIEGITFELPHGLAIAADAGSTAPVTNGAQLTIRRNVFIQSTGAVPLEVYWNEDASVGGTVRIVNNLMHDNSSATASFTDPAAIWVNVVSGKPTVELTNNTVVNNGGVLGGFSLVKPATTVPVYAYNNIFYGNTGKDFLVNQGTAITLGENVIKTHTWDGTTQNDGTTTADPQLDPTTFRPIESPVASNVINTGTNSNVFGGLPATDLSGRDRQIGSEPDRGAFESTLNDFPIIQVTTTADSGVGSLRSAIAGANANATKSALLLFNLGDASGCPYTISPLTALPQINSSIAFAGSSQLGSKANTLPLGFDANICVILDGTPHGLSDGLYVSASATDSVQVQISGMAFSGFSHGAISIYGGANHTVTGSRIGGNEGGVALDPSGNGIIIGPGVHDVTIGGGDFFAGVEERNLIDSATGGGIVIDGATASLGGGNNNRITGNFIGVGYNTNTSTYVNRGNGAAGVTIAGPANQMYYNLIGYNGSYGVTLTGSAATGNTIIYNEIGGFSSSDDIGLGNGGGVVIQNGAHDDQVSFNNISYNSGTGIRVVSGQGNYFNGNSLYGNNGLGIDLAGAGVTDNDNDSTAPANYANRGLNFPNISKAIGGHTHGYIDASLLTTAGTYEFSLYASLSCDGSGHGEGQTYIDAFFALTGNVGTNGQFLAPLSVDFDFPNTIAQPIPRYLTMTASDASGNTSEFSACFLYIDDTVFADGFD